MKKMFSVHAAVALLTTSLTMAGVLAPLPCRGQQKLDTVVFVPGLKENRTQWSVLAGELAASHLLYPWKIDLPNQSYYSSQATNFKYQIDNHHGGSLHDIAAISHSNGGVVVRVYVKNENQPRVNRHLSIGTPHKGASLAEELEDGTVIYTVSVITIDLVEAFGY